MKKLVNISFFLFLAFAFAMVGCTKMDITPEEGVDMELPTKKQVVDDNGSEGLDLDLNNVSDLNGGTPVDSDGGSGWIEIDNVNDDDDAEEDDEQQTLVDN
ncbi:MAG: hypothetical protein ACPGED_06475 [Flavobacteriales bacterium]